MSAQGRLERSNEGFAHDDGTKRTETGRESEEWIFVRRVAITQVGGKVDALPGVHPVLVPAQYTGNSPETLADFLRIPSAGPGRGSSHDFEMSAATLDRMSR